GLFRDSFSVWLFEKERKKSRVMKEDLSNTLCALAKLKLQDFDQSNRRDQDIFYECCAQIESIWEKCLTKEKRTRLIIQMSDLIVYQISCSAEDYVDQLAKNDEEGEEQQNTEKKLDSKEIEKIINEKKSARKNVELAKNVADEICKQLLTKLQDPESKVTVK